MMKIHFTNVRFFNRILKIRHTIPLSPSHSTNCGSRSKQVRVISTLIFSGGGEVGRRIFCSVIWIGLES